MSSKITRLSPHLLRHAFAPGVIRAERERMSIDYIVVTRGPAPTGSLGRRFWCVGSAGLFLGLGFRYFNCRCSAI